MNKNHHTYHPGHIIWLSPFKTMGIETHQGIKIPYQLGIPGQSVKCRIKRTGKKQYEILKVKFTSDSVQYQKPLCPYFPSCGGCRWLHVQYKETLRWKTERIRYLAENHQIRGTDFQPLETNENPYLVRYKAIFPVQQTPDLNIGLFKSNSHDLVDIEHCMMLQSELNVVLKTVKNWMRSNNLPGYNEKNGSGLIRYLMIQKSLTEGSVLITLITTKFAVPQMNDLVQKLQHAGIQLAGINLMKNARPGNTIITHDVKHIHGHPFLPENLFNIRLKINPQSFFQINKPMAIRLFKDLRNQLHQQKISAVIELYAGTGIIGMVISDCVQKVYAFENNSGAVNSGLEAIRENKLKNFKLYQQNMEEANLISAIEKRVQLNPGTAVFADPPRKGLSEKVHLLLNNCNIRYFIYMSCEPESFFTDAVKLQKADFSLKWLKGYDFFSYTHHLELLGIFKKE